MTMLENQKAVWFEVRALRRISQKAQKGPPLGYVLGRERLRIKYLRLASEFGVYHSESSPYILFNILRTKRKALEDECAYYGLPFKSLPTRKLAMQLENHKQAIEKEQLLLNDFHKCEARVAITNLAPGHTLAPIRFQIVSTLEIKPHQMKLVKKLSLESGRVEAVRYLRDIFPSLSLAAAVDLERAIQTWRKSL